jgi:flavodoxin
MKGIIIYFSQTKNTEKVAKKIATGIREIKWSKCRDSNNGRIQNIEK